MRPGLRTAIAVIAAMATLTAACGDDDANDDSTTPAADTTGADVTASPAAPTSALAGADVTASPAPPTSASTGQVPLPTTTSAPMSGPTTAAHGSLPGAGSGQTTGSTVAFDPEQQAAADAYRTVVSSEGPVAAKVALIEDGQQVRATLDAYLAAAETVNGIDVTVTDVQITGNDADITYDLLLAGNPTYPGMKGRATKVGNRWIVPRDEFCSVVSHVPGVSCPS